MKTIGIPKGYYIVDTVSNFDKENNTLNVKVLLNKSVEKIEVKLGFEAEKIEYKLGDEVKLPFDMKGVINSIQDEKLDCYPYKVKITNSGPHNYSEVGGIQNFKYDHLKPINNEN